MYHKLLSENNPRSQALVSFLERERSLHQVGVDGLGDIESAKGIEQLRHKTECVSVTCRERRWDGFQERNRNDSGF